MAQQDPVSPAPLNLEGGLQKTFKTRRFGPSARGPANLGGDQQDAYYLVDISDIFIFSPLGEGKGEYGATGRRGGFEIFFLKIQQGGEFSGGGGRGGREGVCGEFGGGGG